LGISEQKFKFMKPKLTFIASGLAATWLTIPAFAANKPNQYTNSSNPQSTSYNKMSRLERLGKTHKANDVIGMEVKNQREKIGKVKELAVDLESGRIIAVILSTGGLLGIGDKHVAVPPRAFQQDSEEKILLLNTDKEKLKAAPEFDLSKWTECCQEPRIIETYRFYGEQPYFASQRRVGETPEASASRNVRESTSAPRLGHVEKASKVIGMPVKNLQDEKLGKVDNLLIDLASGRVVQVIVSSGGFLGLGDELSAVPPAAFRFNAERDEVRLDVSKDALAKAPHFKASEWPNLDSPVYVDSVYRAYRVEPYFSTNTMPDVDNTSRNVRDRSVNPITTTDQSNADVDLTRRLRQDILSRPGLSANARNVKVITVNGRVTLRGPVNTEEEKRLIGNLATELTGAGNVDNQIEVNPQ
jgi:hyperosmotically inducible protein